MNLILPDGNKIFLKGNVNYAERLEIVKKITDEYEWYFNEYWDNPKTAPCLDKLARYLSRASDFKDADNPILSTRKHALLEQGDWKCRPFSDFPKSARVKIGVEDVIEDSYDE